MGIPLDDFVNQYVPDPHALTELDEIDPHGDPNRARVSQWPCNNTAHAMIAPGQFFGRIWARINYTLSRLVYRY
jgi:hypothetical protein